MNIVKSIEGNAATLAPDGRLDTTTAPELEAAIDALDDSVTELTLDLENLRYISSAGLRVLLNTQKKANASGGTMKLTHVNEEIMDVFDMTGFVSFLTIE